MARTRLASKYARATASPPAAMPRWSRAPAVPAEPIAPAEGFIAPEPLQLDEPVAPLDLMPDEAALEAPTGIEPLDDREAASA